MSKQDQNQEWSLGRANQEAPRPRRSRGRGRRFLAVLLVLVSSGAIIGGVVWNFFRSDDFPKLLPGRYIGTMSGSNEFTPARDWILTISDDYKKVSAIFLGQEGAAYMAQRNGSGYLVVAAGEQQVVFHGSAADAGRPQGRFHYEDSRRTGTWSLERADIESFEADKTFRNWMVLRAELSRVERDIVISQRLIPAQKAEIEELSQMITDEGAMKERAAKRIKELDLELAEVQAELLKARKQVESEEAQLKLAQKVSARGKLVSLARESLERESRWARSLLVGSLGAMSTDLEDALKRAEEIKTLKEALAHERQSVEELSAQFAERGV